jgi:HK97 family phage major capsid protein
MSHSSIPRTASRSRFSLTDREQSRYSLARAILASVDDSEGGLYRSANSFELEISDTIAKTIPASVKRHGGIFVPFSLAIDPSAVRATMAFRAGLDSKTATKGAEVVFTEPGPFIEFLYNRMVCKALGAEVIDGLQGNLAFPKQTGKVTGNWVAENPGVDVADSNLTLGQIPMSLHTYAGTTSFSRQLLAQSTPRVDAIVSLDLARDAALAIDKAALVGDGTGNSPVGILHAAGVQVYTLSGDSGNGAKPTYADIVGMEQKVEDVNADTLDAVGWTTVPAIKTILKQTPRVATSIALPAWQGNELDDYPALVTNQLPKNLTEGTGTNVSLLIFGAWSSLAIGMWGAGYELVVDPYRLKKQGMIEVTAFLLTDVAVRQPVAFIYAKSLTS